MFKMWGTNRTTSQQEAAGMQILKICRQIGINQQNKFAENFQIFSSFLKDGKGYYVEATDWFIKRKFKWYFILQCHGTKVPNTCNVFMKNMKKNQKKF